MLLFHGTRGDRALVESIAADGLRGFGRAWTHAVLGREACTFLANAPVAGHGGDPVHFAMGFGRYRQRASNDGWIIVVDLPPEARGLVRAVIPNTEVERYFWRDRTFAFLESGAWLLGDDHELVSAKARKRMPTGPRVIEVLAELGPEGAARAKLHPVLLSKYEDLGSDDFSFANWTRYADALRNARTLDDVIRAGRRWGFRWEHPEVPHCELCVASMATWAYAIDASPRLACACERTAALPASFAGRDFVGNGLDALAGMVRRWFEGVGQAELIERFESLRASEPSGSQSARDYLVRVLAIAQSRLPAAWRSDFGAEFDEGTMRAADGQLVCDAIPSEYLVGALRIATGGRLRPWARPKGGETLMSKLWQATHALRRASRGPATVYDG